MLSALINAAPFMTDFNQKVIFNSFIKGRYNYCTLLWMFSTRAINHKINRLHERELTALLSDENSTFQDKLSKSNDTAMHVKNIQKLIIEFYKYLYTLSSPIMKEAFTKRIVKYNLQSCRITLLPNPRLASCLFLFFRCLFYVNFFLLFLISEREKSFSHAGIHK